MPEVIESALLPEEPLCMNPHANCRSQFGAVTRVFNCLAQAKERKIQMRSEGQNGTFEIIVRKLFSQLEGRVEGLLGCSVITLSCSANSQIGKQQSPVPAYTWQPGQTALGDFYCLPPLASPMRALSECNQRPADPLLIIQAAKQIERFIPTAVRILPSAEAAIRSSHMIKNFRPCYKVGVGYLHSVHDGHSQMHEHALADAARALPRVRPLTPAVTTTPRMLTAPDA